MKPEDSDSQDCSSDILLSSSFQQACTDHLYLLERGYPPKKTAELSGNRYRLSSVQRSILRRGIAPKATSEKRKSKLLSPEEIAGQTLAIDGCNVTAIVGNYLSGYYVYIAMDGLARDAAESRGIFRNDKRRQLVARLTIKALSALNPGRLHFYIDEPLTHSRDLARELRKELSSHNLTHSVELVHSADNFLKNTADILVSADSEIVDTSKRVFDLARFILETSFDARIPDLNLLPGF